MAELDQDQTIDTGTTEATQTPLDDILDTPATDAPAQEVGESDIGGLDAPRVPLVALKRERERRQKADKQVEELRAELDRFDNAKWGFEETQVEERLAAVDDTAQDPVVLHWKQSEGRHKADEDKINAGLKRLSAEQQHEVQDFVKNHAFNHPDPVGAIRAYVDSLGLLEFKGTPIGDVLASKGKEAQPQPDNSQFDRQVAELNRHGAEVAAAERRATVAASRIDFVSEHGKAAYDELDRRSLELVQSGHPVAQQFVQAVQGSQDPIGTAAQILHQLGAWQPPQQQAPQQQMTFPSNLASRRNVGQRHGPSYAGPTPLNDIFRH